MNITLTQSEAILIKNSLNMMRSYIKELNMNNDEMLSSSKELKEIEAVFDKIKDANSPEKVDTLVDNMEMNCYTWDPDFYNEIVKDWNYRFPKFSYTQYPEFKKGI